MVIMSGEMVVDYSLRLKRELRKNRAVWVFDYFNDVGGLHSQPMCPARRRP